MKLRLHTPLLWMKQGTEKKIKRYTREQRNQLRAGNKLTKINKIVCIYYGA